MSDRRLNPEQNVTGFALIPHNPCTSWTPKILLNYLYLTDPVHPGPAEKSIGATMRNGQEIQCLPYVGFLLLYISKIFFSLTKFLTDGQMEGRTDN